ncbi:hypothetical protein WOLCODRAFT_140851 [Wolfiporia cocos MD-104 SS10]|uniref:Uncharacterized protein n=1 Tax=Wolfiporia cocos (strain MD-104) TaxID=742152 RepID=A0A2H3J666_WOLCO|nr:hypothetical protein WOLCODRAFT_140851 [Wolfiporia cocos MD-104 SS10]
MRALRTSDTLDLTAQLLRINAALRPDSDFNASSDDALSDHPERELPGTAAAAGSGSAYGDTGSPPTRKRKRDDTDAAAQTTKSLADAQIRWTRWPLRATDVPVPEWTFEDEVNSVVLSVLHPKSSEPAPARSGASRSGSPDPLFASSPSSLDDEGDDVEDSALSEAGLRAVAEASAIHVARILSMLAASVPPLTKAMMYKLRPLDWVTVLHIVSVSGLVDASTVQSVSRRMKAIYGPADFNAVERMQLSSSVGLRLAGLESRHELSYLDRIVTAPPPKPKRVRKTRRRSQKAKAPPSQAAQPDSSEDDLALSTDDLF